MSLKEGYIEIFLDFPSTFIMDSNGFGLETLKEIDEQNQIEPEDFGGMENCHIYIFKPEYTPAEEDHMGRITAPGYWMMEQDDYCKRKQEEVRKEIKKKIKESD